MTASPDLYRTRILTIGPSLGTCVLCVNHRDPMDGKSNVNAEMVSCSVFGY